MPRVVTATMVFALVATSSAVRAQSITDPRAMAEWEELEGVVLVWYESRYLELIAFAQQSGWTPPLVAEYQGIKATQAAIVEAVLEEGIEAFVPDDTTNAYDLPDTLASLGLSSPGLHIVPYDGNATWMSVWIRDTGPFNVYENGVETLHAVGWQRNASTATIASGLGLPCIELPEGTTPFFDGGNYMTDGHGKLFCDDRMGSPAPYAQTFRDVFGLDTFVELPPYRIHVDYYMKLLNEELLVVSDIPQENYIGIEPSFDDNVKIALAIQAIQDNAVSCFGRPYEIVRIRNAPSYDNWALNLTYLTTDASYTNSLILNKTVMVPTFEYPATDTVAVRMFERLMPGYRIVEVPSVYFAAMGGTVHCITKEVGVREPLRIAHAWYPDSLNQTTDYTVRAAIQTRSGVSDAALYWTTNPAGGYEAVPMATSDGLTYAATIPGQPYGTRVHYYIEAISTSGRSSRKPIVAPDWAYNFLVDPNGAATSVWVLGPPGASELRLSASTPNPFRWTTSFELSVARDTHAAIRVYDVTGRLVGELLNRRIAAAERQRIAWDGRDRRGARAAAGVYFIRVEAGDESATRKVLLLR